jgi:prepilin-type N-terminal cleavage/methylation domain-containing protein
MRTGTHIVSIRGAASPSRQTRRAFTLIEMLVVLIIIVLLTTLALPNIRGNLESRAINGACNQLMNDLAFARQKAISMRGTVAIVFLTDAVQSLNPSGPGMNDEERAALKRLQAGAFTHYALFAFRRVGEQPGTQSAGYISEWKTLPEKTFLADYNTNRLFSGDFFPFPLSTSPGKRIVLSYIAFDSNGKVVEIGSPVTGAPSADSPDPIIEVDVARGAILYTRDANGVIADYVMQQVPPNNSTQNVIRVETLTGRAAWIRPELK